MNPLLNVFLSSIFSVIVLFALAKLMGKRQMSQLSLYDYINGITIGSIAAEMATSLEDDLLKPLIAMVVYALASIAISLVTSKSITLRRFFYGKPLVLMSGKKLYLKNLKKGKLDLSEFLTQCRISGFFDLSDIESAVLEPNGRISFLPVSARRPATPEDMSITVQNEKPALSLIMDGKILPDCLKQSGNNEVWLKKQLKEQGTPAVEDVVLAVCDSQNQLTVFKKDTGDSPGDVF